MGCGPSSSKAVSTKEAANSSQPQPNPNSAQPNSEPAQPSKPQLSDAEMALRTENVLKVLADIPLLSSLTTIDQRKMAKLLKSKSFAAGEELMTQGEVGKEFYIIVSGECSVTIRDESGNSNQVAALGDGDYCGEQALLQDASRGATVKALKPTECLCLGQAEFKDFIRESNVRFAKRDAKRCAVSAEQFKSESEEKRDTEKSEETRNWLLTCVESNVLFKHLENDQRLVVIDEMYKVPVSDAEMLIKQGEEGNTFYVIEQGKFSISVKDVGIVDTLEAGRCVGELALLYNAPRAASVQCTEAGSVWAVERSAFRKALMNVHKEDSERNLGFLRKCELLQPLLKNELELIDMALHKNVYPAGNVMFKIGDVGHTFYLVREGKLSGVAKDGTSFELEVGSFFGERALLTLEPRAATITCQTECVLLELAHEDFTSLLGPLEDIMKRNMEEYEKPVAERKAMGFHSSEAVCGLQEFDKIGILGRGAFGTVSLVVDPNTKKSYALKAIRKNQVVELGQQSHILNEKRVMSMLDNNFLVNLRATYKDEYKVYFLLEVCLGGELFTILRKMRSFDEPTARFYAACVVEAFDYMHQRDVIYRDLKPENLVLTDTGYLKVTDFGFAKVVPGKTFTLCGTPDYLAPEIVTGQGHGRGVDWWTLGILVYEMLASFPPFFDDEPMATYRKIIQGKFKFPRYLSVQAKDIISRFLKPKATRRLGIAKGGATLIRTHPWFADFDWQALKDLKTKPPIRPKVKAADDISNFDHFDEHDEDLTYRGDADLGWDDEF